MGGSVQQTGALVGDFDGDGVNEFVCSFRQKPPALIWYRRTASGWDPYVIEKEFLTILLRRSRQRRRSGSGISSSKTNPRKLSIRFLAA
jgi:hypothetical protein